jgi:hypothetical protein
MAEPVKLQRVSLRVTCSAGEAPIAGAWVTATLQMNDKTDFVSFHGPGDEAGSVDIRGDDILEWAKRNSEFAPADYADPETDWSGRITLTPLTPDAARAAIKFYKMFQDRLRYPETFATDLRAWIAALQPLQGQELTVSLVEADPPELTGAVRLRRRPV